MPASRRPRYRPRNPAAAGRVARQVAVNVGAEVCNAVNAPILSGGREFVDGVGLHRAAGAVARYKGRQTNAAATVAVVDRAIARATGN